MNHHDYEGGLAGYGGWGGSYSSNGAAKSDRYQPPADKKNFGVKVEIEEEVYDKIMHWIDKSDFEVSGLGMVEHDPETNVLKVTEAILLPQKNTQVSTEIDGQDVARAMFFMKDKPGSLRFWWHSHVDMDVFWSGTDVDTIKQLGSGGWFLATVFNKKREMKSAFCQIEPIAMIVDNLETEINEYLDDDLVKEWDAEYEKNVTNENLADKVMRHFPTRNTSDAPPEPEQAEIFPREETVVNEDGQGLTEDEIISYFKLQELHEMKERGEISEELFIRALDEASNAEIDEYFHSQELEDLDISTRSVDNDDDDDKDALFVRRRQ